MGRPKRQTVDYFPHYVYHGKTMFILEERYGNDGYAFWFKLLEILGATEGHCYDANNPACQEYLASKTRLTWETCENILNLLSRLGAIDTDLWSEKFIWSENLVSNLDAAYRNRKIEKPVKPDNLRKKPGSADESSVNYPQMKVNEMKVNEMKKNLRTPKNGDARPPHFQFKYFDVSEEHFEQLTADYPGLNPPMLEREIKKAADYVSDNSDRFKRNAQGKIKNPKLFLRNWLNKVDIPANQHEKKDLSWMNKFIENS